MWVKPMPYTSYAPTTPVPFVLPVSSAVPVPVIAPMLVVRGFGLGRVGVVGNGVAGMDVQPGDAVAFRGIGHSAGRVIGIAADRQGDDPWIPVPVVLFVPAVAVV